VAEKYVFLIFSVLILRFDMLDWKSYLMRSLLGILPLSLKNKCWIISKCYFAILMLWRMFIFRPVIIRFAYFTSSFYFLAHIVAY
jgi:hypothetical protein